MIYIVSNGELSKIGYLDNVHKRIEHLQIGSPAPITLVAEFRGDQQLEKDLHSFMDRKWVRGEWFNLDADDLRSIELFVRAREMNARPTPPPRPKSKRFYFERNFERKRGWKAPMYGPVICVWSAHMLKFDGTRVYCECGWKEA